MLDDSSGAVLGTTASYSAATLMTSPFSAGSGGCLFSSHAIEEAIVTIVNAFALTRKAAQCATCVERLATSLSRAPIVLPFVSEQEAVKAVKRSVEG